MNSFLENVFGNATKKDGKLNQFLDSRIKQKPVESKKERSLVNNGNFISH
jgi:hypothetical protein